MSDLPKRADAQTWRPDASPEDSASNWSPDRPDLASWGVTQVEALAMIQRQMCPVCGEGPWKSPLTHAAKRHGIDRFTMRDLCGLTVNASVVDDEYHERLVERGRSIDMAVVNHKGKPRRKQRWTTAGAARNAQNLVDWEVANPDAAKSARSEAGKRGAAARWSS